LIELEYVVVVVGEYYYNNSKRGIEKISTKRKIGEDPPNKVSSNKKFHGNWDQILKLMP
jgi:hypothetical protein